MMGMDLKQVATDGSSCCTHLPICNGVVANSMLIMDNVFISICTVLVIVYVLLYVPYVLGTLFE